ncbi:MAG: tail fiber domain-containing protein [Bacteroidales bacterium]|nr:tail fiber domain-containing protein [Bacteroidales bacterium]
MKKLTIVFGIILLAGSLLAQTPQSFKYQAIARDNLGNIIADQDVSMRISILEGSASGTAVYTEIHVPHTNQFGLFNLSIGQGTVIAGNLGNISWGTNTFFIKTEMDPAGGTTYALMGTSQLLSVPYALYSENAANVNDADADPSNELQTLSKVGKYIELSDGGLSVIDEVDDADNDPANELQILSKVGKYIELSNGGGSVIDEVDDADNSQDNELQTLSVNGSNLSISNGNTVSLPTSLPTGVLGNTLYHNNSTWKATNNLYNDGTYIGIGTSSPAGPLHVNAHYTGNPASLLNNSSNVAGSVAVKSTAYYDTRAYLGVMGKDTYDGYTGLDLYGDEIGALGLSLGVSATDNYGLYGYSNGKAVYGLHSTSGRIGHLGGPDYGAYGEYSSDRYGYLGGIRGAYGQYSNNLFGYLGGINGAYGQYNSTIYGSLGNINAGVFGHATSSTYSPKAAIFECYSSGGNSCVGIESTAEYSGTQNNYYVWGIHNTCTSAAQKISGIHNVVLNNGTIGHTYGISNVVHIANNNNQNGRGINVIIERENDSYSTYGLRSLVTNGTTTYGIYCYATGGNTNYAGYFSGNVTVSGTFNNPSDRKFKENLSLINSPLDKIQNLNSYSYTYKTTGEASKMNFNEGRQFGFVAQELENIFPELVSDEIHSYDEIVMKNGKETEEEHSFKYKGINYIGMIPVLTEAIKEQQDIIEKQQSAIEKQQKEIDELKVLVGQLME